VAQSEIRRPVFLERALGGGGVEPAQFPGSGGRPSSSAPKLRAVPAPARPEAAPPPPAPPPAPPPPPPAPVVAIAEVEARLKAEFAARMGAAIELINVHGERIAAEARVDAIEIAFLVARKIIDTEITTSIEPLVGIIRTAVRRLGESRQVVVKLCPQDAEAIAAASAARGAPALGRISAAQIEIVADAALGRGDCVVEGDFATVDGRLSTRIEELRRAVLSAELEEGE
jgi:flagellar assembly protein FliH